MTTASSVSVAQVVQYLGVTEDASDSWREHRRLLKHRAGRLCKLKLIEVDEWVRTGYADEGKEHEPGDAE